MKVLQRFEEAVRDHETRGSVPLAELVESIELEYAQSKDAVMGLLQDQALTQRRIALALSLLKSDSPLGMKVRACCAVLEGKVLIDSGHAPVPSDPLDSCHGFMCGPEGCQMFDNRIPDSPHLGEDGQVK